MNKAGRNKIVIGISSCLMGQKVRFDGNPKESRFVTGELTKKFEFVAVCPEMAIGLGVPRNPIHLVGDHKKQRAVNIKNESIDVTEQLVEFGKTKAKELDYISGYIFKKGSPSCGLFGVKIYKTKNNVLNNGTGIYAQQIIKENPNLPVEEEGRLNDLQLRANFLQRVEVYARWQKMLANGITKKALVDFHTRHKFVLLAHCETTYRTIGPLIASLGDTDLCEFADDYITMLMTGLKKPSSRGKHTNVMEHLLGYFKRELDAHDKSEMRQLIEDYRTGEVPREAPLALLKHYLRKFPSRYVDQQYYLHPIFLSGPDQSR